MTDNADTCRFHAFISYKRGGDDEKYARWLQRKLESYRIPTQAADGAAASSFPKRFRVFRDKTDLGSHANLDQGLTQSLDNCRYLIVVCSPRSAASPYVNDEVRHFRERGRGEYIIPFIIEGTPVPARAGEEPCYPPALTPDVLGVTLAEGSREEALIKVVARLLRVDFSLLYQRHLRAQRRSMAIAMGMALSVLALVGVLAVWALLAERKATAQRKEAEGLVRFLTFDLRDEAFSHIPLKARKSISDKVEEYYRKWGVVSESELYNKAVHASNAGLQAFQAGNITEAGRLFREGLDILEHLQQSAPDNAAVLVDISMALRGLGGIALVQGDLAAAQGYVSRSAALDRRLLDADPLNPAYLWNLSESLNSHAVLAERTGDVNGRLDLLKGSVGLLRRLAVAQPDNQKFAFSLSSRLGGLCAAQADSRREDPLPACEEALRASEELLSGDPHNLQYIEGYFHSFLGVMKTSLLRGALDKGFRYAQEAAAYIRRLRDRDPDNNYWLLGDGMMDVLNGWFAQPLGETEEGKERIERGLASLAAAAEKDPTNQMIAEARKWVLNMLEDARKTEARPAVEREISAAREKLARAPSDKVALLDLATALAGQAKHFDNTFRYLEALPPAVESERLFARYVAENPGELHARAEYADLLSALGGIQQGLGDFAAADARFREALEEYARVEKQGGSAVNVMDGVSNTLGKIGALAKDQDDIRGFLRYSLTQTERARAVAAKGGDEFAAFSVMFALQHLAEANALLGRHAAGLAAADEALLLAREFVASSPVLLMGADKYMLAGCLVSSASMRHVSGQSREAAAMYDEALRAIETHHAGAPLLKEEWRSLRAMLFSCLALLHKDRDDETATLAAADETAAITKGMTVTRMSQLYSFLQAQTAAASLLCERGKGEEAEKRFEEAALLVAAAPRGTDASSDTRCLLAAFAASGAEAALLRGKTAVAGARLRESLSLAGASLERSESVNWRELRSSLERLRGDEAAASGDTARALAHYEQSVGTARDLADLPEKQRHWTWLLVQALEAGAKGYDRAGRADRAREWREEAGTLRRKEAERDPDAPRWKTVR